MLVLSASQRCLLNVWSALIISLALTKAHLLPAPVLLFKPYLLTPSTRGDKQRLDTQAALSKPPPTHFDRRCLAPLASFLMLEFLWTWFGVIHKMPKQQCAFELPLPDSCFILHPTTIPLQHHLTQRHTQAGTHALTHILPVPFGLSVPPWLSDFGSERTGSWCGICSTSVIVCWTKLFLWVELLSGLPP